MFLSWSRNLVPEPELPSDPRTLTLQLRNPHPKQEFSVSTKIARYIFHT